MNNDQTGFARTLSHRHVAMIALGGTIGTGLFLGAGSSIHKAGPAILLVYIITGLFVFAMMRALGELLVSDDSKPVFIDFMTQYLGERAGFVLGWTYWIGWVVIAMTELTAIGTYMHYWFPDWPVWPWELAFLIVLYFVNTIAVKIFGETEFWFAMIKIVAIVAMIITGLILALGHVKTSMGVTQFSTLWSHGLVADHGKGLLSTFQMAFFAFLGVEFVGITAAETKDPLETIPRAVNSIVIRILIFYIGALSAIMIIQPWTNYQAGESPFVQVFSGIGIQSAAAVINFVVLTAAASAINSAFFTTGRMLYSLVGEKSRFKKLNKNAIPKSAINLSTLIVGLAVVVNYLFPTDAFTLISSMASAAFLLIYMALMVTHLRFRKATKGQKSHGFQLPLSPFSNYLTIAFLALIFVILLVTPATTVTTLLAVLWMVLLTTIAFFKFKKN
ncbi:amino acid permease [Fructobacillus evanidus]|uniref:L-asparagine transporter or related permease (AnsP) n=1 Tax=Fructobacillus evanidus TaxID=3064281 RepID=A0ABN9YTG9_9LACO|nr:L-asparagine transporter or related permease (AnsP) [Fructobacillus sp. LMG 32999]CAK1230356.1 L-asparagine transporter or related permease (AnsP) [Fructobacillus sp. LMG 32999]CAK1233121.1 L-asparagine transporter or related permease (AnsP) [Fructobacillus sp. LMG 32999]CAK1233313.1 L-asparagine transporter or related permease (AnsP) [Fructobacillus sp. LMG 32999]CAK1234411.1 L-asparagine transporter or related permease (AnsP) [Fructobacillus sp. LMG 32999]